VLVAKGYPHHGAVVFGHIGKALYTVFNFLGVPDIGWNQPANMLYPRENPFN
jgi:L-fucose isomerase-like protein